MNKLIQIYTEDIEDYFRRLGGQGRYDGYQNFHSGVLILCLLFDLNVAENIHPSMLNETNQLPLRVKEKLKNIQIDKKSFEDYINFVKSHLSKKSDENLSKFESFIEVNKKMYEDYLKKLN